MTIAILVGSTFLLLGLLALLSNEKQRMLVDIARTWPVVTGQVCESRVHYARPKMDEYDCLVFSYRYDVDEVSHIGKSIDLFGLESQATVTEMEKIVQAYPQGAQVKIHYDANDPLVSVIEPEHRLAYFRIRNLGALLTFAGILILCAAGFA